MALPRQKHVFLILLSVLVASQGSENQHFKLKSHLNKTVIYKIEKAEEVLNKRLSQKDSTFAKLTSQKGTVLQPLYFHVNDYFIYVNNMQLTSGEFVIEETNLDVLGHEMMPLVYFPWVEVKGKIKSGKSDSLPQRCDFRLVQNDLRGKGIVSLSVDLLNVTWAYFFFQPNATSLEVQDDLEDSNGTRLDQDLNFTHVGQLIGKKLQREVSHQLTQIVSEKINQTMRETVKAADLETFQEEVSDISTNNTDNANSFIDGVLEVGSELIKTKYRDHIQVPDIHEWFSEKFVVTFRGSFRATEGTLNGVSTIYRVGDTVLGYDNETLLHFHGMIGFKKLHLVYNYYKAEIWGWGPSGSLQTSFAPVSTVVLVHLNLTSKIVSLEKFKIANVGEMDVRLTGLGRVADWLVSRVSTWVMGLFRDRIIHLLESHYQQYSKDILNTYNIEQLLGTHLNQPFAV